MVLEGIEPARDTSKTPKGAPLAPCGTFPPDHSVTKDEKATVLYILVEIYNYYKIVFLLAVDMLDTVNGCT